MSLIFEWNEEKAALNKRKHGLSFSEAATAFGDPFSLTVADPDHSGDEDRFITIGRTEGNAIAVVVHAERGDNIRIISARKATRSERGTYEEG